MAPGIMVKIAKPRSPKITVAAINVPQNNGVSQDGFNKDMIQIL